MDPSILPEKKQRLPWLSVIRCDHSLARKATNSGSGWPLIAKPDSSLVPISQVEIPQERRGFGIIYLNTIEKRLTATPIFGRPIVPSSLVKNIKLLEKKQDSQTILNVLI